MSNADGSVLSTTKIVDYGPASAKWNLVLVPDGYRATEMNQWHTDAQDFVDAFFAAPPFNDLDVRCAINVYRIDVTSTDSGADDPSPCGTDTSGTGATPATYFDATFCSDGRIRRLLGVNTATVTTVVNAHVPQWDQVLVIVNSTTHGGSGGQIGVTALSGAWENTAIHEIGHSAFGLADEYEYYQGCGSGETGHDTYTGAEPAEANVTIDSNRATIKWRTLIAATTAMPTTTNANCSQCDPQANPVAAATVGAFEGARYFHCGLFRPVFSCMMRNFAPFCAVCRRRIRQVLQPFVSPTTITLDTPSLSFVDIPAGETTVRAVVFSVTACFGLTFEIVSGPTVVSGPVGTTFTTPLGLSTVSGPPGPSGTARLWIGFTGTNDGDTASGTVTVRLVETGQQWVIPITTNTVRQRTAAVVLVLDQSGSMDSDAGNGKKRVEVLRPSASTFVDVLRVADAVGIVSFDHNAYDVLPVTAAGPLNFGAGRAAAKAAIAAHAPNPAGSTSIGDGVELGHSRLPTSGFDIMALVVLTDGQENSPRYIADVAGVVNERVFAIGLGTPDQINPVALNRLTNNTGGYVLMTGTLSTSDFFRLSKYYLQILAGVTNAQVVLDPDGALPPKQEHRIPFDLCETEHRADVILLTPAPWAMHFALETPDGEVIDPSVVSAIPGISYATGREVAFYRFVLPLPSGSVSHAGTWHAVLRIDEGTFWDYLGSIEDPWLRRYVETHGLPYNVSVQAASNLRLQATLLQSGQEPGADLFIRASLTEYDALPVTERAEVVAEVALPDGTAVLLILAEVTLGVFEGVMTTKLPGIYTFRVRARGTTLSGCPFTREQLLTGMVWRGGDAEPPTGDDPIGEEPIPNQERDDRPLRPLPSATRPQAQSGTERALNELFAEPEAQAILARLVSVLRPADL